MSRSRRQAVQFAAVLTTALVARVLFAIWWQYGHLARDVPFAFPDSASYWELGRDLAEGRPYEFGSPDRKVFRAPGYPLLLAGLFGMTGTAASPLVARLLGAVLGTLTTGAVYWLARRVFNPRAALYAAAIVALYPGAIATSGLVLAEAPFCLWMMLQLALWHVALVDQGQAGKNHPTRLLGFAAGLAAGVATLTRPSWLLFTPLAAATSLLLGPDRRRQTTIGLSMVIGLALAMAPWWIRNWQVTGQFVPTTLQVGASLYDGLNPAANGSSDMRFVTDFETALREEDARATDNAQRRADFELRLDRRLRAAAIDWALQHPARVVQLVGIKFLRLWNVWPNEPDFRSWWLRLAVLASYGPVMVCAVCGLVVYRQDRLALLLVLSPAIYVTLMHVVFIGSLRYRQPPMLLLSILAGAYLASRWQPPKSPPALSTP